MNKVGARLLAIVLLAVLAPLMLLLALGVFASVGSPVLFRQTRSGQGGRTFAMLKFRSMHDARGADGVLLPDDRRVTAFGRFLRRSRLDELPGLANIVTGDIAFVGPRPLLPETIRDLGPKGVARGTVKPGLTGWSQVNGNTKLPLDRKVELDLWYIANRSRWLDLRILARTFSVMTLGEKDTEAVRRAAHQGEKS